MLIKTSHLKQINKQKKYPSKVWLYVHNLHVAFKFGLVLKKVKIR